MTDDRPLYFSLMRIRGDAHRKRIQPNHMQRWLGSGLELNSHENEATPHALNDVNVLASAIRATNTAFTRACEASQPSSARVNGLLFWLRSHTHTQVSSSKLRFLIKRRILPGNKNDLKMASNEHER